MNTSSNVFRDLMCAIGSLCLLAQVVAAQSPEADELRSGKSFLETPTYSLEEDKKIIELFQGLRVADVSDGMDFVGLPNTGLVDPEIGPLWKDTETFKHRIIGVAVTTRYVPTQDPFAYGLSQEDFDAWVGQWYGQKSPEPFVPLLREGSVLVIDEAEGVDVGSIGSNNIMGWEARGCVGVITDGTARDTDEIITQKNPLYLRKPGRGIRPGRNVIESVNKPVVLGGALVVPGDVIVSDGDGIIVVPRKHAERVAKYAHGILEGDKAARRRQYERQGRELDESVK